MAGTREHMLASLKADPKVQVVVIGGGINGISTFRELSLQGVRVLLVDRGDWCGECSSAPSRMIHGGLRYLENGEIHLVHEALRERNALLKNAPHFVRPLPTTVPIHHIFSGLLNSAASFLRLRNKPAERGALPVKLGLTFYDLLSREGRSMPTHTFRGREATAALFPDLPESVRFTATYYDAWISYPERLGIELLQDGLAANPAALAVNHLAVVGRDGRTLRLRDEIAGGEIDITADIIVNATGAWIDQTNTAIAGEGQHAPRIVGGTKGSHLVLDHPELRKALAGNMIYFENVDGRVCIVYPYLDKVLLGSTDIRLDMPAEIRCEDDEVDYMLKSLGYVFPRIVVRPENIIYRYSGVRPLPRSESAFTGRISRDHFVEEVPGEQPTFCLVGGKWTTFRAFGEQAADTVLGRLGLTRKVGTQTRAIGGGANFPMDEAGREALVAKLATEFGVSRARAAHAIAHYGTSAAEVLAFCRDDGRNAQIGCTAYTESELRYLIRSEYARSLPDLLQRRTSIAITGAISSEAISVATAILADELAWSPEKAAGEERAFRLLLARNHGLSDGILAERDRSTTRSLACA